MCFPGGASGKEPTSQCRRHKRHGFNPWVRKIPWRRAWQHTPVLLPGESHGQRNLAGFSTQSRIKQDMIKVTQHSHPDYSNPRKIFSSVTQLYLTLCNPMACSLLASSVLGVFQARVLAWIAISFSRVSSQPRNRTPGLLHCRQTLYRLHHHGSPIFMIKRDCTMPASWHSLTIRI